ncbi:hypothetical protein BDY24DRAFT_385983 [Mrakia frigida]|uniref:uncharacterized protein n=1 Tax=Mrakia frigida TaxID=29902 RepID=UPI003FCC0B4A
MPHQSNDSMVFSGVVTALVSSMGLGMLIIQVASYLLHLGNRETRLERATVGVLFLLTSGRTVCDCSGALRGVLGRLKDTTYVIQPRVLMESAIAPLLGVLIIGICHIFIANRILSFASSVKTSQAMLRKTLQWFVGGGVVICCLLGIGTIALIWTTEVFVDENQSLAVSTASMQAYTILSAFYSIFCCLIDILLSCVVAFEVRKSKSQNNTNADRVLRSLLRNSVCSAVLTGICQILKTVFLFYGFTAWGGTCFSIASTTYVVFLLLSISLPRSAGSPKNPPPTHVDISSINEFFSSSNNNTVNYAITSDTRNNSDEKMDSRDVERDGSKGKIASSGQKIGLGEMLSTDQDPSTSNFTSISHIQCSDFSRPSSPTLNRPTMKNRSRSYYSSRPQTPTPMLEEPLASCSPTVSRQSSLVRSTIGRGESRRRKKEADLEMSEGRSGGDIEEGADGLNIKYILSGLHVHSIAPSNSSRSSKR